MRAALIVALVILGMLCAFVVGYTHREIRSARRARSWRILWASPRRSKDLAQSWETWVQDLGLAPRGMRIGRSRIILDLEDPAYERWMQDAHVEVSQPLYDQENEA